MLIAVVNNSTLVQNSDVDLMCKAIQIQMDLHFFPAWNIKGGTIKFYSDIKKVPGYAWKICITDSSTDGPGVLGYHSENNDIIDGYIFVKPILDNGGVILYDNKDPQNISVASVISHEAIEQIGDPNVSLWCDGPKLSQGSEYAVELADPVEGDLYPVEVNINGKTIQVALSNFIFPSWFNSEASIKFNMPFDYLKKLTAPFTMSKNAYMVVRNGPGTEQQVFAENFKEWKKEIKKSELSRFARRSNK